MSKLAYIECERAISFDEYEVLLQQYENVLQKFTLGGVVLIVAKKSIISNALIQAAFRSNIVYSIIDPETPLKMYEHIIGTLQPALIIKVPADLDWSEFNLENAIIRNRINKMTIDDLAINENDVAYVLFTSGTTGMPKGVIVNRLALEHYLSWYIDSMSITELDVLSSHPEYSFDLSVPDIFVGYRTRATTVLFTSKSAKLFPSKVIQDRKITVWNSVPSVVELLEKGHKLGVGSIDSIRRINFCGGPLMKSHLDWIFKIHRNVLVQNTYGPTEATVSMTAITLNNSNYKEYLSSSACLGREIPNMKIFAKRETSSGIVFEPFSEGETSEAIITGVQVASGYFRNTSETRSRFIYDDTLKYRGYLTGDLLTLENGDYYFSGRIDDQIKYNGFRIELGQIEAAAEQIGLPKSIATLVDGKLYLCVENHPNTPEEDTISLLKDHLPSHCFPMRIKKLSTLPHNSNGKRDRKALVSIIKSMEKSHEN